MSSNGIELSSSWLKYELLVPVEEPPDEFLKLKSFIKQSLDSHLGSCQAVVSQSSDSQSSDSHQTVNFDRLGFHAMMVF